MGGLAGQGSQVGLLFIELRSVMTETESMQVWGDSNGPSAVELFDQNWATDVELGWTHLVTAERRWLAGTLVNTQAWLSRECWHAGRVEECAAIHAT